MSIPNLQTFSELPPFMPEVKQANFQDVDVVDVIQWDLSEINGTRDERHLFVKWHIDTSALDHVSS